MSSLRDQVEDLNLGRRQIKDIDPEDDLNARRDNSDSSDESNDELNVGREHYEAVGKSKLRKPEQTPLGKEYRGVAVSRAALNGDDDDDNPLNLAEESEDEDPFATRSILGDSSKEEQDDSENDLDNEEADNDETFGTADNEVFTSLESRGIKSRYTEAEPPRSNGRKQQQNNDLTDGVASDDDSQSGSDEHSEESRSDEMDESESDMNHDFDESDEQDEDDLSDDSEKNAIRPQTQREELKALLSGDTAAVAASLTQAASSDAKKGKDVKQQYQTFDRLLDARIKLQKGLTAANDMKVLPSKSLDEEADTAIRKAEEAALNLFSTIDSLRHMMLESVTSTSDSNSKKRKRPAPSTVETSTTPMWSSLCETESRSLESRRNVIDKWSNKIRASDPSQAASSAKSKFLDDKDARQQARLSAVLDTYLLSERDRLLLAVTGDQHGGSAGQEDGNISDLSVSHYDDGAFYQSLLRDLINSRAAASNNSSTPIIPVVPLKLHPSGNKSKQKIVDTRASKGRKIRYTVHEKLQNFMAPEGDSGRDISQWTEAAKSEFFGSLMGQSRALDEDEDVNMNGVDGDIHGLEGGKRENEALRLFRS